MPVMVDLCCGRGGASQAMRARGWTVYSVDIRPDVGAGVVADLRALPLKRFGPDLLWMSAPCDQFSRASMPWFDEPAPPSLELVEACMAARDWLCPRWWVMENVRGARRWLKEMAGPVRAMTTGHVFWGNLPLLLPDHNSRKDSIGPSKERALLRAMIPESVSLAVALTVERLMANRGI